MLFTGSSGDGLRIISCIVSRCGFGLAFRPDTGSPPKSPNDVLILMGQFQNCATADILIERQTGGQGAQDYLIAGAKIQGHATLRGIEIDGAANVAMRSLYFEIGSNVSLTMATYDSGTGKATVTTSGSHAFRVNQVVHVEGIQNPPMGDYNGKFIITAVGTDPAQPTTFSYTPRAFRAVRGRPVRPRSPTSSTRSASAYALRPGARPQVTGRRRLEPRPARFRDLEEGRTMRVAMRSIST